MNILKKTKIILVILLVLFVCFFFCCQQKKENYIDVNHLKVACKKENTKKICPLVSLIPKNAKDITVSHRSNRIKNITISFKCPYINWKSYIQTVDKRLKNYSISSLPKSPNDKTVYFFELQIPFLVRLTFLLIKIILLFKRFRLFDLRLNLCD